MTSLIVTLTATTLILWQAKRRTDANLESLRDALTGKREGIERSLGALDQITRPRVSAAGARPDDKVETERILQWALSYYDSIPRITEKDEKLREVVAIAHRQAGFCRMALGRSRGRDDYRQAINIYEQLAAQNPEQIWLRTRLIETLHEYSRLLTAAGDQPQAEALFRRSIEVAETLIGNEEANKHCFTMALIGPFNNLAWDLVRYPRLPQTYALQAIRLTRQATAWEPEQAACWRTLGVAHYRLGEWAVSASALTRSKELSHGQDPVDTFFLAAIAQHRGQTQEARHQFDAATRLIERNPGLTPDQQAEVRQVQREVSQVLPQ
jgi:tetratricopeptide (TPR) repeat protein